MPLPTTIMVGFVMTVFLFVKAFFISANTKSATELYLQ